jgi:hypothetical protein
MAVAVAVAMEIQILEPRAGGDLLDQSLKRAVSTCNMHSFSYCISFICFIGAGSREQALEVIDTSMCCNHVGRHLIVSSSAQHDT